MTQQIMDLMYVGGPAIDMNAVDISTSLDMEVYGGSADLMTATSLEFPADLS